MHVARLGGASRAGRLGLGRVAVEPVARAEPVVLLRPHQPGERAPQHVLLLRGRVRRDVVVELVGLDPALGHGLLKARPERVQVPVAADESQPDRHRLARLHGVERVPGRELRARHPCVVRPGHLTRGRAAVHDVVADAVLGPRRGIPLGPEERHLVALIVRHEHRRRVVQVQRVPAEVAVVGRDLAPGRGARDQLARPLVPPPRPRVAEPQLRQQVQRRVLRPVVGGPDLDTDVVRVGLGVGDLDVEEPVLVQHPGVTQLGLAVLPPGVARHLPQQPVRELALRVPVDHLHPRVRGRPVRHPPVLLDVLAVVALFVGEPEVPLLEDRVPAVPQRDGEVEEPVHVADPRDAVLTPPVSARTGVVERERRPRVAPGRVVLPDGAPLATRQIRPPQPPRRSRCLRLRETRPFRLFAHRPSVGHQVRRVVAPRCCLSHSSLNNGPSVT